MKEGTVAAVGAVTAGVVDGVVEGIYLSNPGQYEGKFPFIQVNGVGRADDLLILAGSALVFAAGHFAKNVAVKEFGTGMLLYSGPMALVKILTYWIPRTITPTTPTAGAGSTFKTRRTKLEELRAK
jgi:hypothetical protein